MLNWKRQQYSERGMATEKFSLDTTIPVYRTKLHTAFHLMQSVNAATVFFWVFGHLNLYKKNVFNERVEQKKNELNLNNMEREREKKIA